MSHQSELISTDINAYLAQHERKELLRFLTCGNVDDGKSTLIGRLLHDSKMIYEDQLAAVQADSVKSGTTGAGKIDLALLVDGLQAEREQGITIDVAYRYFSTSTRKFIIADTPGHEQYTRNMATGASTCDLAVILIDARYGVQTQTKRHSFIASLLGIKHIIVAINKMDLVEYSELTYNKIKQDYIDFIASLELSDVHFIPMSALDGDNVVNKSKNMPWYTGKAMMKLLNSIKISNDHNLTNARFPVQYVNRPNLDFRGFCGTVASGIFRKGDSITVLPSGKTSKIKSIITYDGELKEAFAPLAVTLTMEDEIDISRGDMIIGDDPQVPSVADKFNATLVWMDEKAMVPGCQYVIKLATRSVSGSISAINYRIDVNTLEHHDATTVNLNEIASCTVSVNAPVVFDSYKQSKSTGAFIIIDYLTNVTVGAGMITGESNSSDFSPVSDSDRTARYSQKATAINLTGTNSQKVSYQLERKLFNRGHAVTVLETQSIDNSSLITAIKNAGLICLVAGAGAESSDITLDCDTHSVNEIYNILQQQKIIL
ncbi:MAG: sulfate adenylyltransferase subunit CysN [Methylococcales symbiont of Iophon sp. n. MRB-2018]|nr:MAG: sulfate adenylyltransferase subunit CysN [Methylococcales symbiont of Iophon sp. n. MRB-2018]KAF3980237.1 MAG: sulfate adenylyltransferase subunit CysN [Methylococcales symbiont of Iophon sp. n. MRB-2018]